MEKIEQEIAEIKTTLNLILGYLQTDSKTGRKGLYEMCQSLDSRVDALEQYNRDQKIKIGLIALFFTGVWTLIVASWKGIVTFFTVHH